MSILAQLKNFRATISQTVTSAPRRVIGGIVVLLVIGTVGAYAAAAHHTPSAHTAHPKVATSASPTPSASPSPTPTSAPAPTTTAAAPSNTPLPPAAAKTIVASAPKIAVTPPAPTTSPGAVSPAVASWYAAWGQSDFDAVFASFTVLGQAGDAGDIDQINLACGGFVTSAQHGLLAPAIPDPALDQRYRASLTQLSQGGVQCVHGIQTGDTDVALSGLDLLQTAGVALAQLQSEIAPAN